MPTSLGEMSAPDSEQFAPRKRCARCEHQVPLEMFSRHPASRDGLQSYCRSCHQDYDARRRATLLSAEGGPEVSPEDEEEESEPQGGSDLYVLANSLVPGLLKIGRSVDTTRRAKQLEAGHPFKIITRAVCNGLGHLEPEVHRLLDAKRYRGGAGREWFAASFPDVMHAIACAASAAES